MNINPENVCQLVQLSRQFHAQEGVVVPNTAPAPESDWQVQILADHAEDASVQEFQSIVAELDPDLRHELVALMWLGRGDYALDEWQDAVTQAQNEAGDNVADYLLSHPLLAEYLSDGLEQHGHACEA